MNITVLGVPKGQPRPRAFARKMGAKFVARMYDSDVADEWKHVVDVAIAEAVKREGFICNDASAFAVSILFIMPRPLSHYRTNGELKDNAPRTHTQKPDADNLAKLVLDRITRLGKIWRDDSQVTECLVTKRWDRRANRFEPSQVSGASINLHTLDF